MNCTECKRKIRLLRHHPPDHSEGRYCQPPGRQPPALEVHGRVASILAAMETAQFMEGKFKVMLDQNVLARQLSRQIDGEAKKAKAPQGLRRGVFTQISKVGEFTSLIGCEGLIAQRHV
jgi:hypothetical protein